MKRGDQSILGDERAALILFDGLCNLCNASVNFIIARDPQNVFRFASLQSPTGQALLRRFGLPTQGHHSIVLVENGRLFTRSTAALRIARRLTGAWKGLYALMAVPGPMRDLLYDWIARNRFRWFGRSESSRIPTSDMANRFIDPGSKD